MSSNQSMRCRDLETLKLKAAKVELGNLTLQNSERYVNVKNKEGKDVFWVDDDGANISALETQTDFVSLTDTADALGEQDSLLRVEGGKLAFTRELNNLLSINTNHLSCNKLKTENLNISSIVSKSVVSDSATFDLLKADELQVSQQLLAKDIDCKKLKCSDFKTDVLDVVKMKCGNVLTSEAKADSLDAKHLHTESGTIENLKSVQTSTSNLTAEHVSSANGNFDNGSFNNLEAVNFKTLHLKALNAKISELELERLHVKCEQYGSLREPLCLAITQTKSLTLNSPSFRNKIISRVPAGVKTQSFSVKNIDTFKDWHIGVTLTKDNEVQSTLIIKDDTEVKVNLTYKKAVEDGTMAIIYLQCC